MASTQYTTKFAQRWDSIALFAYGDETKIQPIIEANPLQSIVELLPPGIDLIIPIIESSDDSDINQSLLPPWKRDVSTIGVQQAQASAPLFIQISTSLGGSFNDSFD